MDNDLKKGLLGKKNSGFDKLYEQCQIRIQRIKQKNDVMQKQIGTQIQQSIRTEVNNQRKFLQKQINELKDLMTKIESNHRDPQSKTKIKQLKIQAQKQTQRNKIILKDLINKSFATRSIGKHDQDQNHEKLIEGGKANLQYYDHDRNQQQGQENKQSILTDQQMEVNQIDYQFQRKILLQKNEMLNQVEQATIRINEIINDEAIMVQQQGQHLDIITEQLVKTTNNLEDTNKNLDLASTLQKKSKKKYIFLVVLLLLIIIIVGGVIYIVTQ